MTTRDVEHDGVRYQVKDGLYYREFTVGGEPTLVRVKEPDDLRSIRLGLGSGDNPDVTVESVSTPDMRPPEVLVALKDAGATPEKLIDYIKEHPESTRGRGGIVAQGLRAKIRQLDTMTDQEQFDTLVEMGVIPKGSEFLPGLTEEQIRDVQKEAAFVSPAEVTRLMDLEPTKWRYRTPEQQAELKQYVADVGDLTLKSIEAKKQSSESREKMLETMSPYQMEGGWDLAAAIRGGIDEQQLSGMGFSQVDIDQARNYNSRFDERNMSITALADFETEPGKYDLGSARAAGITPETMIAAGFDAEKVNEIDTQYQALTKAEGDFRDLPASDQQQWIEWTFRNYASAPMTVDQTWLEAGIDPNLLASIQEARRAVSVAKDQGKPADMREANITLTQLEKSIPVEVQEKQRALQTGQHEWDIDKLNSVDRAAVINTYAGSPDLNVELENLKSMGDTAVAFVPIAGTIVHWDRMSTPWKAVSIVGDVLFFATPLLLSSAGKSAVAGAVRKLPFIGSSDEISKVARVIGGQSDELLHSMVGVDPKIAPRFSRVSNAAARYGDDIYRIGSLEQELEGTRGGIQVLRETRAGLIQSRVSPQSTSVMAIDDELTRLTGKVDDLLNQIDSTTDAARNSQQSLERAAADYANQVKAGLEVTDPQVISQLDSLPNDMLRSVKSTVRGMLEPTTNNLDDITRELAIAEDRYKAARLKWPDKPQQWADLRDDVARLTAKRMEVMLGNITKTSESLSNVRQQAAALRKYLNEAGKDTVQYREAQSLLDDLVREEKQLSEALRDVTDWPKIEWTMEEGRGGTATRTKAPAPSTTGTTASISSVPAVQPGITNAVAVTLRRSLIGGSGQAVTSPLPSTIPYIVPMSEPATPGDSEPGRASEPEIISISTPAPGESTPTEPSSDIVILPESGVGESPATEPDVFVEPVPAIEPAPAESTAPEFDTETPIDIPPDETVTTIEDSKIRGFPPDDERRPEAEEIRTSDKGALTWRQGIVWKIIRWPWKKNKPVSLTRPALGTLYTDLRTPQETIQILGSPNAKVPRTVSIDLGTVDIFISDYGRKIEFRGGGLNTDVGSRDTSRTRGMSIPGQGITPRKLSRKKKRKSRNPINSMIGSASDFKRLIVG